MSAIDEKHFQYPHGEANIRTPWSTTTTQNYHTLTNEPAIILHSADPPPSPWTHVADPDSFFKRVYWYRHRSGLLCIVFDELFHLTHIFATLFILPYLIYGIDYALLLGDNDQKQSVFNILLSLSTCIGNFQSWTWHVLFVVFLILIYNVFNCGREIVSAWNMRKFYESELEIQDRDLHDYTWYDVQTRLRAVQPKLQICINKNDLTDLDVYHRILRQENYLVAMINQKVLAPGISIPFLGEYIFWTESLCNAMTALFFRIPGAIFKDSHLDEKYKDPSTRHELAAQLKARILWFVAFYTVAAPFSFVWQLLLTFLRYLVICVKEPGALTERQWSLYGRMYLRHFNELDHELDIRLSKAYGPAIEYLSAFNSPVVEVIARGLGFHVRLVWASIFCLCFQNDDFLLNFKHGPALIAILSVISFELLKCQRKVNRLLDKEYLMGKILVHTNYLPLEWMSKAHTAAVRQEIESLLPYDVIQLVERLLNPLLMPFILYFCVRPRALDFVDFFRNFTVDVSGVGDVCSFAEMKVRKHGNAHLHHGTPGGHTRNETFQAENGKVEFSLVHFAATNPAWQMEQQEEEFVRRVKTESTTMVNNLATNTNVSPDQPHIQNPLSSQNGEQDNDRLCRKMLSSEEPNAMSANSAYLFKIRNIRKRHVNAGLS